MDVSVPSVGKSSSLCPAPGDGGALVPFDCRAACVVFGLRMRCFSLGFRLVAQMCGGSLADAACKEASTGEELPEGESLHWTLGWPLLGGVVGCEGTSSSSRSLDAVIFDLGAERVNDWIREARGTVGLDKSSCKTSSVEMSCSTSSVVDSGGKKRTPSALRFEDNPVLATGTVVETTRFSWLRIRAVRCRRVSMSLLKTVFMEPV